MKKFLTLFVIALMSFTCFLCACGDNGGNGPQNPAPTPPPAEEEVVKVLEFQKETESVRVYEEVQLLWDYEHLESARFTFTSSSPSTATVDENGKVIGVAEGTAVITISADGLSDTISVTVNPYNAEKLFVINTIVKAEIFEGEFRDTGIKMGYVYEEDTNAYKAIDLGSITYTIPAEDADIATVDANGKITAVGLGETTMHVVAKVGNTTIDEFDITIEVKEKVELNLSATAFQIFVSEGSDANAPKPTEYTLTAEAKVNNVVVEDANISYTGYDEELITVDPATGKISAVGTKIGSTTITITFTSDKGTTVTKTVDVSVGKPKLDKVIADSEYIVNTWGSSEWEVASSFEVADFSTDYMFDSINSVLVDGRVLGAGEYSYDGYKLSISRNALKNTTVLDATHAFTTVHNVKIDAENPDEAYLFDTNVTTIDYAIDSAAAFEAYSKVLQEVALTEQIGYHAILTANIDYAGKTFVSRGSTTSHGYATGILDGRGFTIANITTGNNAMFWGFAGFTLKNIAFVNAVKKTTNDGAILAWNTNGGNNVIENVYLQGQFNGNAAKTCGLMNNAATVNMKNFIIDVEATVSGPHYAMDRAGSSWHGENTIAISSSTVGFADCLKGGDANNFYLKSVLEIKNLTESSKNAFTSVKVGENAIWELNAEGVLVFKSAVAYLDALNEEKGLNEIVVDTTDFIKETNGSFVIPVGSNPIKTNLSNVAIALAQPVDGVSIVDGAVVVADTVPAATEITLNISANEAYTGKKIETSFILVVGSSVAITLEGDVKEIVKNQPTKSSIEIDLGDNELQDPITLSVKFKGSVLDAENVTVSGKTLTVNGAGFVTSGEGTLEIYLKTITGEGDSAVTTYYVVKAPVSVVDYEIGTAAEFAAYMQDMIDNKLTENTIAKLTADIDYAGARLPQTSSTSVGALQGVLDGQGHYISNYKVYRYSTFAGGVKNAVVKNIAFINIVKDAANDGGLFSSNENVNVVMENVLIQGKVTIQGTRLWGVAQNFGGKQTTLKNVIVMPEFTGQGAADKPFNLFGYTGSFATATNAFGVSLTAQGYSNAKDGEIYGSLRHLTSTLDEATIKAFTDTGVWGYDATTKSLYFGTTRDKLVDAAAPEFAINTEDFIPNGEMSVVLQESTYNLTADYPGTEFELKEEVAGISIVNNVLSISKDVELGTIFTVKATAYGNIANTPATKEISLLVGEVLQTERYIKNKATVTNTDISKFGATVDNTVVTINGEAFTDFTIENGILKLTLASLPASLVAVDGEMVVEPLSAQIVVSTDGANDKVIIAKYEIMDILIETAQDFKAWVDTVKAENKNAATNSYWVELAKDIDLKDITFEHTVHNSGKNGTGFVQGLFNGNGHTVSNLTVTNVGQTGIFQKFGIFTLENVAFVNANATSASAYGYMFAYAQATTSSRFTVKNSYIDFTSAAQNANGVAQNGGIIQAGNYLTIEDSLIVVTTNKASLMAITGKPTIKNSIIMSSTNKALGSTNVTADSTNWGFYTELSKVATAACDNLINIDHFDELGYWNTAKNYPVWVGAKA